MGVEFTEQTARSHVDHDLPFSDWAEGRQKGMRPGTNHTVRTGRTGTVSPNLGAMFV
jgi:hypothetical protein